MIKNEQEALALAQDPTKIISAEDANTTIAFLNGLIIDLSLAEFEAEIAGVNELAKLMNTEGKTNKVAETEWKCGDIYRKWRLLKLELAKLRAYRNVLREREKYLQYSSNQYGTYQRAIS